MISRCANQPVVHAGDFAVRVYVCSTFHDPGMPCTICSGTGSLHDLVPVHCPMYSLVHCMNDVM